MRIARIHEYGIGKHGALPATPVPVCSSRKARSAAGRGFRIGGGIKIGLADQVITRDEPEVHLLVAHLGIARIGAWDLTTRVHQQRDVEVMRPQLHGRCFATLFCFEQLELRVHPGERTPKGPRSLGIKVVRCATRELLSIDSGGHRAAEHPGGIGE